MKITLEEKDIINAISEYIQKNYNMNALSLNVNYDVKESLFNYRVKIKSIDVEVDILKTKENTNEY
ncbi:hypothetical protein D3C71_1849490 [compost metagenome]